MSSYEPRPLVTADLAIYPSTHPDINREGIYQTESGLLFVGVVATAAGLGIVLESGTVLSPDSVFSSLKGFRHPTAHINVYQEACQQMATEIINKRENLHVVELRDDCQWEHGRLMTDKHISRMQRWSATLRRM